MLTVWEKPERWSGYVLGVDTAEGLGHGDYSCVQVIDVKAGEQVAVWHGHIPQLLRNYVSWAIRTFFVSVR